MQEDSSTVARVPYVEVQAAYQTMCSGLPYDEVVFFVRY